MARPRDDALDQYGNVSEQLQLQELTVKIEAKRRELQELVALRARVLTRLRVRKLREEA